MGRACLQSPRDQKHLGVRRDNHRMRRSRQAECHQARLPQTCPWESRHQPDGWM